jgi:glycosyltransferase involved in cell wall biosynthesis
VIPTKNAADVLPDCLASVSWADEIIVVDMHSTDATAEICRAYPNVRLFEREDYIFGNVNFGFDRATSDWTLRLDSDERISPELASEIRAVLADPPTAVTGYYFRQRLYVLGQPLYHGRAADIRREMLFRTGATRYEVRAEHESLATPGEWRHLNGYYAHLSYRSVTHYLTKFDYYTSRDAERLTPLVAPSTMSGIVEPIRAFYLNYIKRRGFRDGWRGLLDAGMTALYQFVQWAKYREAAETRHETTSSATAAALEHGREHAQVGVQERLPGEPPP